MDFIAEKNKTNISNTHQLPSTNKQVSPDWELVRQYLPLLKSIVSKMTPNFPPSADRESIFTIGLLGLIAATQAYNKQTYNGCFGAYAKVRIKGALLDELRRLDWLPRSTRTRIKLFKQRLNQCEQSLKRPLSNEEICNYLHISKKELIQLKQLSKPFVFVHLDFKSDIDNANNKNYTLEEKISDTNQINGREICEKNELKQILKEHLKALPKMVQQIFALHYYEGLRLSEIAVIFKLSESRISQIHSETIVKLRQRLLKSLEK